MEQQPIITSYEFRMERAKEHCKQTNEVLSKKDMEAYAKFFLLEDVLSLCKVYLKELETQVETDYLQYVKNEIWDIDYIERIKQYFQEIVEVSFIFIEEGYYKSLRKIIPEKALMREAKNLNFSKLAKIAIKILFKEESKLAEEYQDALNQYHDMHEKHHDLIK